MKFRVTKAQWHKGRSKQTGVPLGWRKSRGVKGNKKIVVEGAKTCDYTGLKK